MWRFLKIFFVFIVLLSFNKTFSYSLNFENNWFYSTISNNVWKLETELQTIEMKDNWWIKEKFSQKYWKDCLSRELSVEELKEIANWSLDFLNYIKPDCLGENGSKSLSETEAIRQNLLSMYDEAVLNASSKSEKLLWFSNIWIYSDWIEGNWPFDLIKDFEEINEILFWENSEYEFKAEDEVRLDDKVKWALEKIFSEEEKTALSEQLQTGTHSTLCSLNWRCDNFSEVQRMLCEMNWNCNWEETKWFMSVSNNFVCKTDKSWLNTVTWKVISTTLTNTLSNIDKNKMETQTSQNNETWIYKQSNSWVPNISWNYSKVNDKKYFPCDNFFCIKIDFKTYNHSFLWGWSNWTPSIMYLIWRSNEHLKKFVNSSLSQSKMTTNNFELWLKDIDLSKMFHMWVQITKEPIPMLYLWDWEEKEKTEIWLNPQLEQYYSAYWLDYEMSNDLSQFKQTELYNQIWKMTSGSFTTWVSGKVAESSEIAVEKLKVLDNFQKWLEDVVRTNRIWTIETHLKELDSYSNAISDYVINLEAIFKKINKIPQDSSKT